MSKTITGRALVPIESAARYSTLQLTSLCRRTALIWAAMYSHTLVVEQLIAAGAALDVQNNKGHGPCADCDDLTLFKTGSRLLGRNAAVILAAMNGHALVVKQLIAAGAALDVQNNAG